MITTSLQCARAKKVAAYLDEWLPSPSIPLCHKDPYTLLIAVLLSAQCQDIRVNQVTHVLFDKASTPQEMIRLPLEEIRRIIYPCGLYMKKAQAILDLSWILLKHHKGTVPASLASLEALPGVGHKTASVLLVQAFNIPTFPVDTHIHRVAKRWGLSSGVDISTTEYDLKCLFPEASWGKRHLQMIAYARTFCKARGHKTCPLCEQLAHLQF